MYISLLNTTRKDRGEVGRFSYTFRTPLIHLKLSKEVEPFDSWARRTNEAAKNCLQPLLTRRFD